MARSSGTRLTKYVSASTIVTAEVANSWYGGLYGTTEGDAYQEGDPVVAGHVHDGQHKDGHAQKVDLVDHVTGQLRNSNLADDAVTKRNVQSFLDQGAAIPVSEVIDGYTYYYLDLSAFEASITPSPFIEDGGVISNQPSNLETDDFVFGSDSLDDDGDITHDSRFLFDKSKGAFRAGTVEGVEWDEVSRGDNSVAFGKNNTASGNKSSVVGGEDNSSDSTNCFIGAGLSNSIESTNNCGIISGYQNTINFAQQSFVGAGRQNSILTSSFWSGIGAGRDNIIEDTSTSSFIGSGQENSIDSSKLSFIGAGGMNKGGSIEGNSITSSNSSAILSGYKNTISSTGVANSIISGGENTISGGSDYSFISGSSNLLDSSSASSILGGQNNQMYADYSSILNGSYNNISSGSNFSIASGYYSKARSYGERVHASGAFGVIAGSAQDFTLIFRKEITLGTGATPQTFDLYLNGGSINANLEANMSLYFTAELSIADPNLNSLYARRRTFLINTTNSPAITVYTDPGVSSGYSDELDPNSYGSWDIDVFDAGSAQWRITVSHIYTVSEPVSRLATCICRGSAIKTK